MQPFSSAILSLTAQSETPTHLTSSIRQCKTWNQEFEGLDWNCALGPWCGGLRWMSRDSEVCVWCMIVCERGDRGAGLEIASFNPSLWTWPLSQLYSSCSNTRQVSSFLLPTHYFSLIWFLVVGRVQARYDYITVLLKSCLHAVPLIHGCWLFYLHYLVWTHLMRVLAEWLEPL